MSITVKYFYSACVSVSTPNIRILCDPWFTDGIYDGSWFQFPKIAEPVTVVGDADIVYISHIHPDHYDPHFLKKYFEFYGEKEVLIADHTPNFLAKKMQSDGIRSRIVQRSECLQYGDTAVHLFPVVTGSVSDIDSVLILEHSGEDRIHRVVNTNDSIPSPGLTREILQRVNGDIDILLCGYTGAGPYPQTYYPLDHPDVWAKAAEKKEAFFERYRTLVGVVNAKCNIPFAGQYLLGGKLSHLNGVRGVADAVEVLDFDPRAVVLLDGGGEIDTSSLVPSGNRTDLYGEGELRARVQEISSSQMDYERFIPIESLNLLPMKRLMDAAMRRAGLRSELKEDYFFAFDFGDEFVWFNAHPESQSPLMTSPSVNSVPTPRSLIEIDRRYLLGLLVGAFHWNNAEVGSQFAVRRTPDTFNRASQDFLNFFSLV